MHVPTGQVPPRWFDLSASRFAGMFDFADAEIADRHFDLKYIHSFGRRFAERLMAAYENEAEVLLIDSGPQFTTSRPPSRISRAKATRALCPSDGAWKSGCG